MTDKNPVVSNISLSESHVDGPVDVIWSSTDFHHESCLPVIGSCQVSSILSTLEHVEPKSIITSEKRNDDLNNQNNDNIDTFKSIPINIINSDSILSVDEVKKKIRNRNENLVVLDKNKLFSEMMYFGCNLCPFICTKDNKISDHMNNVHRNKENNKKSQLKCPGCTNIFYHKLSLRSHLIHDHEVGRNDINKIVNSIVYVSVLSENNNLAIANAETNEALSPSTEEENKNDSQEYINEDIHMQEENLENLEENNLESVDFLEACPDDSEKSLDPPNLVVNEDYLPKQENSNEQPIINTEIKQLSNNRRGSFSKEEQKRTQKCCISTCAVRMNDIVNMSYHIKCHFGKIFQCLECSANFVVWKTLQTHLWRAHNINMELYSCDKCEYKTYSLAKLNNIHKLIHGDEKPFLCDLCGKGFKNTKQLRNHKIIHKTKNVEKMHQCSICDRAFADKRLLKVHISAVHQKLKPFSCSYCGYKAASNGALKLHVRIHTGQKPFSCDSCDYSTADHNSLRRHKSRHSGEKKYKCAHCDYACIQSSTYKTHLKTKHPGMENELMFSCHYCQFRSVNKDKYMIHIASHKDKKDAQKIIDIFENICEDTEGLEERVVEIVTVKNKKIPEVEFVNLNNMKTQQIQKDSSTEKLDKIPKKQIGLENHNFEDLELRLQETPVALISKSNDITQNNHCIILPVQNENILNLTNSATDNTVLPTANAISTSNIQYYYTGTNVLLEIIDEKPK